MVCLPYPQVDNYNPLTMIFRRKRINLVGKGDFLATSVVKIMLLADKPSELWRKGTEERSTFNCGTTCSSPFVVWFQFSTTLKYTSKSTKEVCACFMINCDSGPLTMQHLIKCLRPIAKMIQLENRPLFFPNTIRSYRTK